MKKRLTLLLVLLALAALFGGAAAIYYAISARQLAKRQAAFRARGSAAFQRVANLLQKNPSGADSAGLTPPRSAPRDATSPTSATRPSAPGQSALRPRRTAARPDTPRGGLDQLELDIRQYSQELLPITWMWPETMYVELKEGDLDARGALTVAARQKVLGMVRKRLTESEDSRRSGSSIIRARKRLDDWERTLSTSPVPDFLARMEDVLFAADWALPDYANYSQAVYVNLHPLNSLAILAILHNALRGDGARAGLLWLRQLEYLRGRYLAAWPKVTNNVVGMNFPQFLFTLGELPQISAETLDQAARLLSAMQPTAQQTADLRRAHALRWVNYMTGVVYGLSGESSSGTFHFNANLDMRFNQNTFHFLQINGIGFDTLFYRLNRPKMNQYLLDYAAAWVDGRRDAMKTAESRYIALARTCNIKAEDLRNQLEDIDDPAADNFQSSPALARLVLAAERYRRDTGQFPVTAAALGLRYLDPPLETTSTTTTGHLFRLDAFDATLSGGENVVFPARPVFYSARELSEKEYLFYSGSKDSRIFHLTTVIPRFPDAWRDELELIRRIGAPADPAAPLSTADSVKNPSNQTSATALKK